MQPPSPASVRPGGPRVALILDLHNHIHRGVLQGLCAYVRRHGPWNFVWVQQNTALPWPNWRELRPDGVIMHAPLEDLRLRLKDAPSAVVNLRETAASLSVTTVQKDSEAVGRMGAAHFVERGFRSLGFIGHQDLDYAQAIGGGFAAEAATAGVRATLIALNFRLRADWHWEDVREELVPWLQALPRRSAVMACNDYFARQLLLAAQTLNMHVPHDLALLGVNDNPVECQLSHVPISSVELASERMGWEAGRLLAEHMAGRSREATLVEVPPVRVVVRRSTDIFAIDDPPIAAAVRYLHQHAKNAVGVEDLVRGSGLSRRQFEVRFRRALGRSPYNELIRARLALAREMLSRTSLKLGAIAEECGFGELKHLHRHFRRNFGTTPAAFRQQVWLRLGGPGA